MLRALVFTTDTQSKLRLPASAPLGWPVSSPLLANEHSSLLAKHFAGKLLDHYHSKGTRFSPRELSDPLICQAPIEFTREPSASFRDAHYIRKNAILSRPILHHFVRPCAARCTRQFDARKLSDKCKQRFRPTFQSLFNRFVT